MSEQQWSPKERILAKRVGWVFGGLLLVVGSRKLLVTDDPSMYDLILIGLPLVLGGALAFPAVMVPLVKMLLAKLSKEAPELPAGNGE